MIEVTAVIRDWGKSKGVVIPQDAVVKEKLKTGEEVELLIRKKSKKNPIKETWGIAKFSRPTEKNLREANEGAWDE